MENYKTNYIYYLNNKTKKELEFILNTYEIEYKKYKTKAILKDLILNNLEKIAEYTLEIIQYDELQYLKWLVKKEGILKVKVNFALLDFLKVLKRNALVYSTDNVLFIMPLELVNIYKNILKDKDIINKSGENTIKYNCILGYVDIYGIVDFNIIYKNYYKDLKYSKKQALRNIKMFATFYREMKVFTNKNKKYIASNVFNTFKEAAFLLKNRYFKKHTNEEILRIHNFEFMKKNKAYKKLYRFVNKYYDVEKTNYKIINKYILIPYLHYQQINKEKADKKLALLIGDYFEYNSKKHQEKFIELIYDIATYYPSWISESYMEKE